MIDGGRLRVLCLAGGASLRLPHDRHITRQGRNAAVAREKPTTWGCAHHYPILVERVGSNRRARCLGCGASGPARADAEQAMLALQAEARYGQRPIANPPIHHSPNLV